MSLGAQVSFVTVIWIFMAQLGINMYAAAGIAVLLTVLAGSINGLIVAKGKIPPFIATLGMQNILFSIALLITKGASIFVPHPIYATVTETRFLHIPLPALDHHRGVRPSHGSCSTGRASAQTSSASAATPRR